ncbi:MAG TPA: hypothetical protein VI685_17665 [Candidatus Angelobacter sp.]
MKVIILAQATENHTAPIKWALEQAGYQVACWGGLSWTEQQQASLSLDKDGQTRMVLGPYSVEPGDAVWIRRPDLPALNPKVAEADRKFADQEYHAFYHAIGYTLDVLPVWCINKFSASRLIRNKAVQLHLARACGLRVPGTVLSNSPNCIRNFFAHKTGRTIGKGFTPHVWQRDNQGGASVTETFELTPEQFPADEVLTFAPAIYQDMVVKEFDVRMVIMGHRLYSYALYNPLKTLDWRQDAGMGRVEMEIVATPPDVEKGVLAFAQKANVCFGSLDFAVDRDGHWWFLEINEQGQFLWLDQFNRQSKLQEKFCAFITAPEGSTAPLEEREGLFPPFSDYIKLCREMHQKLEPIDMTAVVASSPYMSREP